MKNNKFNGWKNVFSFTFSQSVKKKGYRAVTFLIALVLFAGIALVVYKNAEDSAADAVREESVENEASVDYSDIKTVYVQDLYNTDYAALVQREELGLERYAKVDFVPVNSREEAMDAADANGQSAYVIVEVSWQEGAYQMEAILPASTDITVSQADQLLSGMKTAFEVSKVALAGLTEEQLAGVMTPMVTEFTSIGEEEESVGVMLLRMLAPMVFGLVLYMMLILYGQDVSREIAVEKTTKLAETLLTSVKPYAMITGKILAICSTALIQFFSWILAAVAGLFAGNAIAASQYENYENIVITVLHLLRDNVGESAFSPAAVVLAVLIFVTGFLCYCVLAGLAGSMASKPEEVASAQALFQFPVIISFLVCYLAAMMENQPLVVITRYIPFTIPFGTPVELITGSMSIVHGLISLAILLVFTILMIILSGRLYEGLILYSGQKVNVKTMLQVLRAKK